MPNLINYNTFLGKLEKQIEEILKTKNRVLISVIGRRGTGKSYFGKYIRKNGFGQFNKRVISVIDDRTMWLEFLYLFQRRVKIPLNGVDELQPFLKKISKKKKIIFYINATPWMRISETDILLKLSTDEDTRKRRLQQRYANKPEKLKRFLNNDEFKNFNIKYSYLLEAKV